MRDMAPKGKKGKKSSQRKQASEEISVPDFPKQLRDWRIRNISWGGYGVSKSWRSVSKQCNSNGNMPQLQLSCANDNRIQVEAHGKYQPHHFLKIPFLPAGFYTSASKLSIWTPFGPCWEWWINPGLFASKSFITSGHMYIPPPGIMLLTGISRPALLFLRPQNHPHVQVEHLDCTIVDPYDSEKQSVIFTNAIGFKGKFYALSLHGALAVVEEVEYSSFTITGFGKNRAVPSVPSRRFIEYLIESKGEILLVFLISRKSISMIDYVEVVKLDLITVSWVKMDSLGDRALFLGGTDRAMSVSAKQVAYKSNQVGYKSNHVYFTHQGINCWKEFDMESRSISPCCNF